jgi:glutamyl/glutaminyl-tRNA synthetase
LEDLLDAFSLARCGRANAIFDYPKLLWLNGHYIRALSVDDLTGRIVPFWAGAGLIAPEEAVGEEFDRLKGIVSLEQERLKTLADAPEATAFFFRDPDPETCIDLLETNRYAKRHTLPELRHALALSLEALSGIVVTEWSAPALGEALDACGEGLGWKRAELLMPVRIAVSGRQATPPLFETLEYVGKEATIRRLGAAVDRLGAR